MKVKPTWSPARILHHHANSILRKKNRENAPVMAELFADMILNGSCAYTIDQNLIVHRLTGYHLAEGGKTIAMSNPNMGSHFESYWDEDLTKKLKVALPLPFWRSLGDIKALTKVEQGVIE